MAKLNEYGLSDQQERFCQEYVKDLNGTQAAIRAGYSEKSARSQASDLLTKPNIQKRVGSLQATVTEANASIVDEIKKELRRIAFADPRAVSRWNQSGVTMKDSSELTDDEAATIMEVSEKVDQTGGSLKIKQHSKLKALELLAKLEGAFVEKHEHEHRITLEELVSGSMDEEK